MVIIMKYLIKDLETDMYYNSTIPEFTPEIKRATFYSEKSDIIKTISRLPDGFYNVVTVFVNK